MAQPKDFGFDSDAQMLQASARKFWKEHSPVEKLRAMVARDPDPGREPVAVFDRAAWDKLVALGWTALAVPERAGGLGMKMVAVAALAEELGRGAVPSPLPSTLAATFVLREAATKAADAVLERICAGESATLAVNGEVGGFEPGAADVTASASGVLDGVACYVQDAGKASRFVVAARSPAGVGLYLVGAEAKGLTIALDRIVDLTRDQARLTFKTVQAEEICPAPAGEAALARAFPSMLVALVADMVGAAEWQLQTTTAYAKLREQFGHAIGFFQAVKHPLVNMMIEIDQARSLLYCAACAIDTEPENAERFARMAKAAVSDTAAFCSDRSVQLHGGIGFTWESDVHIFFKRQKHSQFLLGDGIHHRARLAELLLS